MERFDLGDEARLRRTRQAFAEAAVEAELMSPPPAARGLSPARLYAYARRSEASVDIGIERALRDNAGLRHLYRRMIVGQARYSAPAAMAAGSTEIPPRAGSGWRISAERTQAEPDQFLVVIEFDASDEAAGAGEPATLILCDRGESFHHFNLPPPRRGVIQMIERADSALIGLLRDPRTEAFLR